MKTSRIRELAGRAVLDRSAGPLWILLRRESGEKESQGRTGLHQSDDAQEKYGGNEPMSPLRGVAKSTTQNSSC
ncbi:hypothetical protein VTH06DRAFT_8526 [Thermothelomyces fergusii]